MKIIDGGVTAAKGFKAAAAAAEIKYKGRTDMAMVYRGAMCGCGDFYYQCGEGCAC